MSKSIKLRENVYQGLIEVQGPRETFSDVILRLLRAYDILMSAQTMTSRQHEPSKGQEEHREKQNLPHG